MPANESPGGGGAAPKPRPPANVRTGANPRGVAIVVPRAAPRPPAVRAAPIEALGLGHRLAASDVVPRAPVLRPYQQLGRGKAQAMVHSAPPPARAAAPKALPKANGAYRGIVPGAAALAPKNYLNSGGIAGRLVSQLVHLPQSTLEGAIGLGRATAHDLTHGNVLRDVVDPYGVGYGRALLGGGNTALQKTVHGAIHSDPIYQAITRGSLHPLAQNPLGTALDIGGVTGLAGRGLGALARSGVAGDSVKAAAALGGRDALAVPMGDKSLVVRNRGFSPNVLVQGAQKALDKRGTTPLIDQQIRHAVATDYAGERGVAHAEATAIQKADKKIKPPGKEEANVARLVIPYGTHGTGDVKAMLADAKAQIQASPESHGATAATAAAITKHIDQALAKPTLDTGSLLKAATGAHGVQDALEQKGVALGLHTQDKLDNALRKQYLLRQPGFHPLEKPTPDPRLLSAVKDAKTELAARRADLEHAKVDHGVNVRTKQPPGVLAATAQAVKDAKVLHDTAAKDVTAAKAAVAARPLRGTMIEDPSVPPLTKGPLKGLSVRPVTQQDYAARLANEPAGFKPTYVTARNMTRERVKQLTEAATNDIPHLAEAGRASLSGEAAKVGDLNPGWGAVVRSHLNTAAQLSTERMMQHFADRWLGPGHPRLADAQTEARDAPVRATTVQWGGEFHNLPTAALDELRALVKADHPGKLMKTATIPNRVFRNTVLAMSPKLPVMHAVENTTRTALMEGAAAHPLAALRAIPDALRHEAVLRATTDPEALARLNELGTPGSMSHSASGATGEDAGKLAIEQAPVKAAAHRFVQAAAAVPHGIIRLQRSLELPAQYAALGAHERQLLQEWGHSWLDANTNVTRYADKLAHGLATPEDAQRAAESMHVVDGQYNAFTARTRQALRFVPFGSWYANAARLVMVTLPKDHPLFDALLQDTHQSMQPQWDAQHKGLPSDMQTSLNVGPSSWLDIGKFTPIGVQPPTLAGAESTASQLFLPWVTGPALTALAAKGPYMSDLYGPNTPYGKNVKPDTPAANLSAVESIIEEFGGPLSVASRALYGHGGTFYPTSAPALHLLTGGKVGSVAVKPGSTKYQRGALKLPPALDKVLDPFHPTHFAGGGAAGPGPFGPAQGTLGSPQGGGLGKPEGTLGTYLIPDATGSHHPAPGQPWAANHAGHLGLANAIPGGVPRVTKRRPGRVPFGMVKQGKRTEKV